MQLKWNLCLQGFISSTFAWPGIKGSKQMLHSSSSSSFSAGPAWPGRPPSGPPGCLPWPKPTAPSSFFQSSFTPRMAGGEETGGCLVTELTGSWGFLRGRLGGWLLESEAPESEERRPGRAVRVWDLAMLTMLNIWSKWVWFSLSWSSSSAIL